MSTRSRIGMLLPDGKVKHIYCHYDGYPENNGKILLQHYTDSAKVEALMNLGDLSILEAEIGEKHDFDSHSHTSRVCLAYGRDRNEANTEAVISDSVQDFGSVDSWIEFCYLYDNGTWLFQKNHNTSFVPLTPDVCGLEAIS